MMVAWLWVRLKLVSYQAEIFIEHHASDSSQVQAGCSWWGCSGAQAVTFREKLLGTVSQRNGEGGVSSTWPLGQPQA